MRHKKRVILVEDEIRARAELKDILRRRHRDVEVVGEAETPDEAWGLMEEGGVDGVFLDINLEAGTQREGMDLAYSINKLAKPPWIVFTTAYREFALEAFGVHPADYLLKPFEDADVAKALAWVDDHYPSPPSLPATVEISHRVADRFGESHKVVEFVDPRAEILYVCTIPNTDKLRVHLLGCRDLLGVAGPLKDWKDPLAPYGIEQTHSSYLVNRAFYGSLQPDPIREDNVQLLLKTGCGCPDRLPVGKYFWQKA